GSDDQRARSTERSSAPCWQSTPFFDPTSDVQSPAPGTSGLVFPARRGLTNTACARSPRDRRHCRRHIGQSRAGTAPRKPDIGEVQRSPPATASIDFLLEE